MEGLIINAANLELCELCPGAATEIMQLPPTIDPPASAIYREWLRIAFSAGPEVAEQWLNQGANGNPEDNAQFAHIAELCEERFTWMVTTCPNIGRAWLAPRRVIRGQGFIIEASPDLLTYNTLLVEAGAIYWDFRPTRMIDQIDSDLIVYAIALACAERPPLNIYRCNFHDASWDHICVDEALADIAAGIIMREGKKIAQHTGYYWSGAHCDHCPAQATCSHLICQC
jgi:hypothetical protein